MAATPKPVRKIEKEKMLSDKKRPVGYNKEHKRHIEKAHKKGLPYKTVKVKIK